MGKSKTDRVVIGLAVVLLLLAGGAYYFDQWMWGAQRARGERIGRITASQGDVRLKFQDDLKWSKANLGQDLSYDDAVYTGDASTAKLTVGQSQLVLNEKSLVVLRKRQGVNFLALSYGSVSGNVAKDEKFVVDTGDGKQLEFSATKNSAIVLSRRDGRAHIEVERGEAHVKVDGKSRVVTKAERLVVHDAPPPRVAPPARLRALKPRAADVIASEGPKRIPFAWAWADGRKPTDDETYTLEFAAGPDFARIHAQKRVRAALETGMDVSQTLSLYYRVRGPRDELSQTERVRFVRIEAPAVTTPLADQLIPGEPGVAPVVEFGFTKAAEATIGYQVARDPDFTKIVRDRHVTDLGRETFLTGDYYVRARGEYGGLGASSWSPSRHFRVEVPAPVSQLAGARPPARALIPNAEYPAELYGAPPERVSAYLGERGLFGDLLPLVKGSYDEVHLRVKGDPAALTLDSARWPTEHLRPGIYEYRYQPVKRGYVTSRARGPFTLEIGLEPPRPAGDVHFGRANDDGTWPVQWEFTPLLFAKSYDVQIAPDPDFKRPVELRTTEARVKTKLPPGKYFWRARARDADDRVISAYSGGYAGKPVPAPLPKAAPRGLASTLTTTADDFPLVFTHEGWYAWVGTGENYIKYASTIAGRAAADYHQITPGSQYVEAGYATTSGIGGVFSFKSTPSEVRLDNATVTGRSSYSWTTVALDAMMRKISSWAPKGEPVVYGVRAGVQLHRVPFLYLDQNDQLALKLADITTAAFGVVADWSHDRWKYYSLIRYQLPLSTQADGTSTFEIKPVFAFDGSVGTSYNLTERLMLGAFWYGQWHQFKFNYAGTGNVNTGYQSLFYSSVDLRLGYEF